jgi:hypothetical protein
VADGTHHRAWEDHSGSQVVAYGDRDLYVPLQPSKWTVTATCRTTPSLGARRYPNSARSLRSGHATLYLRSCLGTRPARTLPNTAATCVYRPQPSLSSPRRSVRSAGGSSTGVASMTRVCAAAQLALHRTNGGRRSRRYPSLGSAGTTHGVPFARLLAATRSVRGVVRRDANGVCHARAPASRASVRRAVPVPAALELHWYAAMRPTNSLVTDTKPASSSRPR